MALTFELATFTVREGEEASLVAERPQMIAALGRAFPGVLGAWLAKRDDGSWVDVILWHSREEAEHAAKARGRGTGGEIMVPTHRRVTRAAACRGRSGGAVRTRPSLKPARSVRGG